MAAPTLCRGCQQRHDPLLSCARAARLAQPGGSDAPAAPDPRKAARRQAEYGRRVAADAVLLDVLGRLRLAERARDRLVEV